MKFVDWLGRSWRQAGYAIDLSAIKHGNLKSWLEALDNVPEHTFEPTIQSESLVIGDGSLIAKDQLLVEKAIDALIPWRKGPISLFNVTIDTEWRSNFKWNRLKNAVEWKDKTILDVGCGNGYFGFRALLAGAQSVIGIDGMLLYVLQAALINWFIRSTNIVLPLRFGTDKVEGSYDVVLSMGVIYHQRDPDKHLQTLYKHCNPSGQVVVESIVADEPFEPQNRYAGMRNVCQIPSPASLENKLRLAGFSDVKLIDIVKTSKVEQRTTKYMPFQSLADVLSSSDETKTTEGYPAPKRAILTGRRRI